MTTYYVGGLRARLIRDNLYQMINTSLSSLGWFNAGRQHQPLTFLDYPADRSTEIKFNTLALADGNLVRREWEIGSLMTEDRWTYYVDTFVENPSLGLHLSRDVADILGGRMQHIGRQFPEVQVFDLSQATPPHIFDCVIENIAVDRAESFSGTKPWERNWFMVRFEVVDFYTGEAG